ncbi:hypothetical protein LCGC14_2346760 [marine sediment metagenome]|uniref:Uncharacterized protein n=1 Tax=marine sediment metagenome TaxID=412755 RepID=A0A0F9CAB3_9ZZZZ
MKLFIRRLVGHLTRWLYPRNSTCHRCRRPWKIAKSHSTTLSNGRTGMFPLCELCWGELTPWFRLPYYRELWIEWHSWPPVEQTWEEIQEAVLEESAPLTSKEKK